MAEDTIFALSSGALPAGVAVIRVSGTGVRFGLETLLGMVPPPRRSVLRPIRDRNGLLLDHGLVLYFSGPASFTGEDVAEFQVHGSRAVAAALIRALAELPGFRAAEPGEFTRRAFENGKADLTEVEGLADLIAAETEMQRRQAVEQAGGSLSRVLEDWRGRLLRARALIEAELDFSDEEDVPDAIGTAAAEAAAAIAVEMDRLIAGAAWGERVRNGFEVVLLGAPNVGKSSLLNALARREAAIVAAEPGTTRDMIEVHLDIAGHAVTLVDTAGLREAEGAVEREGIRRASRRGAAADLVLLLDDGSSAVVAAPEGRPALRVATKVDLASRQVAATDMVAVSAVTGEGLDALRDAIAAALALGVPRPAALLVRERQRQGVAAARDALRALPLAHGLELKAEQLRRAADAIGRVTGRFDVEEMLGVIFAEFCIGK